MRGVPARSRSRGSCPRGRSASQLTPLTVRERCIHTCMCESAGKQKQEKEQREKRDPARRVCPPAAEEALGLRFNLMLWFSSSSPLSCLLFLLNFFRADRCVGCFYKGGTKAALCWVPARTCDTSTLRSFVDACRESSKFGRICGSL